MATSIEKIQAQIIAEVDDASLRRAGDQVNLFARDTKKQLDQAFLFNLQLDKAKTKLELDKIRGLLAIAKKEGDQTLILKYTIQKDELQSKLTEIGGKLRNLKNTGDESLSRLQKKFNEVGGGVLYFKNALLAVGAAFASNFSIDKIRDLSDSFTSLENRLRQVAEGDALETLKNRIFEGAQEARVAVNDYASVFTRLDLVNKELGGSQEETLIIVDSLAKGLAASGATGTETASVMLQLSQAFGAGRLQGDEFRSISENMPGLLTILAKKLGVTRGELKQMAADGEITSQVLKESLIEANEQLNESFDKSSRTIGQVMTQATNKFILKFGELDKAYGITEKIAYGIDGISNVLITGVSVIAYFANVFQKAFVLVRNLVGSVMIGVGETIFGVFANISENTGILVENMGRAFDNLPAAMEKGIKGAIKMIGQFIDAATFGLGGKVANALGLNKVVDDINIFGSNDLQFKAFKGIDYKYTKKGLSETAAAWDDLTAAVKTFKKESPEASLRDEGGGGPPPTPPGGGGRVSKEKDAQEELKKLRDKEYKEDFERQLRRSEWLKKQEEDRIKREEERNKKIEEGREIIRDYYNDVREAIDDTQNKLDEFADKIEESQNKILDLQKDLTKETRDAGLALAERRLEIEERIAELSENSGIRSLSRLSEKTLKDIGEGSLGGDVTGNMALEYKRLQEELTVIQQNGALITEEIKNKASESESERILREFTEKQTLIQQELAEEQLKLESLKLQKEQEALLYTQLDEYRTTLEKNFTNVVASEAQKRISELEKIRQKAIQTANALAAAGVVNNNTTTNSNKVTVNLNGTGYASQDAKNIGDALTKKIDLSSKGIN